MAARVERTVRADEVGDRSCHVDSVEFSRYVRPGERDLPLCPAEVFSRSINTISLVMDKTEESLIMKMAVEVPPAVMCP